MKYSNAILFIAIAATSLVGTKSAQIEDAITLCRSLHHMDIEPTETGYFNDNCLLNCNIHGRIWTHFVNDGMQCGDPRSGKSCHEGSCVSEPIGHIDIEIESVSLSRPATVYVIASIFNLTAEMKLPIEDRSHVTTCTSHTISGADFAKFNTVCTGSGALSFRQDSRVTFEVFDHFTAGSQTFLGGSSLTIPQLLSHGDSYRTLHLALVGGRTETAGQINARITWTPIH